MLENVDDVSIVDDKIEKVKEAISVFEDGELTLLEEMANEKDSKALVTIVNDYKAIQEAKQIVQSLHAELRMKKEIIENVDYDRVIDINENKNIG